MYRIDIFSLHRESHPHPDRVVLDGFFYTSDPDEAALIVSEDEYYHVYEWV